MKSEKSGLGSIVLICALLGVAGAFWLHSEFEDATRSLQPTAAPMQFGSTSDTPGQPSDSPAVPDAPDPQKEMQLGSVMAQQNRLEDALEHYRQAARLYHEELKTTPNSPDLLNNLAWLLAANPNAEIRNGKEAVELAQKACELTEWRVALAVGTLATADAETGQFDEAVKMAHRAEAIAMANGQMDLASKNEKLAGLFEGKQPYHEAF